MSSAASIAAWVQPQARIWFQADARSYNLKLLIEREGDLGSIGFFAAAKNIQKARWTFQRGVVRSHAALRQQGGDDAVTSRKAGMKRLHA